MKILVSGIGVMISLLSCQPKDQLITPNKDGGGSSGNVVSMSTNDQSKLALLSLDRVAESVTYIKAVLNKEYATQLKLMQVEQSQLRKEYKKPIQDKAIFLQPLGNDNKSIYSRDIFAPDNSFKYSMPINKKVSSVSFDKEGRLISMTLETIVSGTMESKDTLGKKFVSSVEKESSILITRDTSDLVSEFSSYVVIYKKKEDLSYAKDKKVSIASDIRFNFDWDGMASSLEQNVLVSKLIIKITQDNNPGFKFETEDLDAKLLINLNQQCTSTAGTLELKFLDTAIAPLSISSENSNYKILNPTDDTKIIFESKTAACEVRPLVDLTRML